MSYLRIESEGALSLDAAAAAISITKRPRQNLLCFTAVDYRPPSSRAWLLGSALRGAGTEL